MEIPDSLKPNPEASAPQLMAQPEAPRASFVNPEGDIVTLPSEVAHEAINQGYEPASPEQVRGALNEEKYGTLSEQAKTFLEGAGVGGTLGISTLAERAMGVSPKDILARAETNPISHGLGQGAGFGLSALIPGAGEANVAKGVGEAGIGALGLAEGAGAGAQIARSAIHGAADFVAMQAGDEISKMMASDPNQSVDTAVTNIGLSGLLGLGGGAALGAVSPLWKATAGNKLGSFIEDFRGRMAEHVATPNPIEAVHGELSDYYKNMSDLADTVYGAKGIKAQGIEKYMPEMSEKITGQVQGIQDTLNKKLLEYKDDPFVGKLQREVEKWEGRIKEDGSPSGIFDATQDLKQQLQEWGKYNKNFVGLGEKDFRDLSKSLAFDLRNSLEDSGVWGKAADIQKKINKGFSEYLPTLKDFEKKFTTEVNGERVIDPGKISTYVNQLGKANAEIKQSMLDNFLKASEKYQEVIHQTHADIGAESPVQNTSLNVTKRTLDKLSPGAKAADILVKKGLARPLGEAAGAGVGAVAGSTVGHPMIGALIGEHALGPFFTSILPVLTKPLLEGMNSPEGMKSAINYGMSVIKGNALVKNAAKGVFKGAADSFAGYTPSEKERNRLDERLKELQTDQNQLFNVGGQTGHYLPSHGTAIAQTAMNAVNYLNSQRPQNPKIAPLDKDMPVSFAQKAAYERTLNIAQQPLFVVPHIKEGTVLPQDVTTMKTLYPALYSKLSGELTTQMIEAVHKEQPIPYKTRQGLTLFLGTPVDSSFLPMSIQSAQGVFAQQNAEKAQMAAQSAPKKSTSKMGEMSKQFQTPQQSASERQLAKH